MRGDDTIWVREWTQPDDHRASLREVLLGLAVGGFAVLCVLFLALI